MTINETRDETEQRLSDGLMAYTRAHSSHNESRYEFYKLLDRQCSSCEVCGSEYVGPSYAWLNRRVTLTKFGQLIKEVGSMAPELNHDE